MAKILHIMQRRTFLLQSIFNFFVGLTYKIPVFGKSNTALNNIYELKPNETFKLPKKPKDSSYITIKPAATSTAAGEAFNAFVKTDDKSTIMGESDKLHVDTNVIFTLIYNKENHLWLATTDDPTVDPEKLNGNYSQQLLT